MLPFIGPSYSLNTRKADVQRAVNLFPVANEVVGGKTGSYMQSVPGLDEFSGAIIPHICTGGPVWTQRVASAAQIWNAIAYGSGRYVAGGGPPDGGAASVMFSVNDGHSWNNATVPPVFSGDNPIGPQCMAYGNGIFVCANGGGSNNCATSLDGSVWASGIAIPVGASIQSVFFDGANFIALLVGDPHCFTSPDGMTWTQRNMPGTDTWTVGGHGGGVTVALAQSGHTAISTNHGASWVSGGDLPETVSIYAGVPYGNGVFVALPTTSGTQSFYSDDLGATWQLSNVMSLSHVDFSDAGFYQDAFLLIDKTGQNNFKSTNGIDFTASGVLPASSATSWAFASDGDGQYAAVGAVSEGGTVEASGTC